MWESCAMTMVRDWKLWDPTFWMNADVRRLLEAKLVMPPSVQQWMLPQAGVAVETKSLQISARCTLRYASASQQGRFPCKKNWTNQDASFAIPHFDSKPEQLLLGVLDGHGPVGLGEVAARIARKALPEAMVDARARQGGDVACADAIVDAFHAVDWRLQQGLPQRQGEVGVTAALAMMDGESLTVAHCGDCRAVLGRRTLAWQEPEALALTQDHRPFRRDECERILKDHPKAEILTQGMRLGSVSHRATFGKQMGCADPPRVWLRGQDHPGCSYTRSLGDALAKKAGVTCDPEILTHMLSPKDAMVVLCTDGVTEFLSNESIIQICSRFKDPAHACEEVVKIAFEKYWHEDGVADDMTVVVVFLDWEEEVTHWLQSDRDLVDNDVHEYTQ